ncbi:hypothetical protein L7F22_061387 [Adiantum nelumboides]|nr:hypothetical protein [Adiantum nelumboides]
MKSLGETSKRGISTVREGENPYQELQNFLLEDPHPSKRRGHAQHQEPPSKEKERSKSLDKSMEEDVAPQRCRAQRSPTPTKRKRSPHSPPHHESKKEEKDLKKKKERKRSPSSPSSSPFSSSDESGKYSSKESPRRGCRRSHATWRRSNKLKKFKEGGKSISFLAYDGTFGATDKVLALIQQFDAAIGDKGFTKSSKLRHVAMHFQKSARQLWTSLRVNGEAPRTWKNLRASIMKQFLSSDAKDKVLIEWQSLKLTPFESIHKQETPPSGLRHVVKQPAIPITAPKQHRMSENGYRAFSHDIPSDITVEVGEMNFSLHKFPLVSRSGWIRKLVMESKDTDLRMSLPDMPGGAEAFEMAAKFCYGIPFEIGVGNVAVLRCAAEFLEMSEEYSVGNLIHRSESYLSDTLISGSLAMCVKILQACESLLPIAEDLDIVNRCIDSAASKACKEQVARSSSQSEFSSSSSRVDSNDSLVSNLTPRRKNATEAALASWAEELSVLRIDFFQKVLAAMRTRGLRYDCLGGAIVHYAQQSLKALIKKQQHHPNFREVTHKHAGSALSKVHDASSALEHEQRILIETIGSLLPPERNTASTSFLFGLLRAAIYLDTTVACRLGLEKRIGMQLEQATLDDLLIPAYSYHGDTLFDVETVRRIVINFLQQEQGQDDFQDPLSIYESDAASSPLQSSLMKVARLLDSFLAEIAPDANLNTSKFVAIGELMPGHSRVVDDGLYRAIDIYLKAHPGVSDEERKRVCGLMECRKLTQEACSHAAQNERLPVQIVVQVLYFEQARLKSAMKPHAEQPDQQMPAGGRAQLSQRITGGTALTSSPRNDDYYAAVCKENRELKMEMARMKMQLSRPDDMAKAAFDQPPTVADISSHISGHANGQSYVGSQVTQQPSTSVSSSNNSNNNNSKSSKKFLSSVSKTLGKLNPFQRPSKDSSAFSSSKPMESKSRRRRHSIS